MISTQTGYRLLATANWRLPYNFPMNLEAIQSALRDANLDGWLFYDHHHRDPIGESILGLDPKAHITRRWYYFVPATGDPRKLMHRIEQGRLDSIPGSKGLYSSWQELRTGLKAMLSGFRRIAMQYSPNNDIMYVSMVDAGTIEFLRSLSLNNTKARKHESISCFRDCFLVLYNLELARSQTVVE